MLECQVGEQDGDHGDDKMVEHGIFPSTKEASMENAITYDHGSSDDDAEHGISLRQRSRVMMPTLWH